MDLPMGPRDDAKSSAIEACVDDLERRHPGKKLQGPIDDATFVECVRRVVPVGSSSSVMMFRGEVEH